MIADSATTPTPNGHVLEPSALDSSAGGAACEIEGVEVEDPRDPRLQMQLDRLAEMADMGMELARGLVRKAARMEAEAEAVAKGEEAGPGYENVCIVFTRVARAVRQINAQEQEILGLREQVRREERQARAEAAATAAEDRKAAVRRQVVGKVRDLLDADDDLDAEARGDLLRDVGRDYNDYYDLYQGSFDEIVQRVCRDLGIDQQRPKPARAKRAKLPKPDADNAPDTSDDPDDEVWRRPYVPRAHGRDPP